MKKYIKDVRIPILKLGAKTPIKIATVMKITVITLIETSIKSLSLTVLSLMNAYRVDTSINMYQTTKNTAIKEIKTIYPVCFS